MSFRSYGESWRACSCLTSPGKAWSVGKIFVPSRQDMWGLWQLAAFLRLLSSLAGSHSLKSNDAVKLLLRAPGSCPVLRMNSLSHPINTYLDCLPMCRWRNKVPGRPRNVLDAMQPERLLDEVVAALLPTLDDFIMG